MDVQLLGPVEVHHDGRAVPLGAPKQRALLAILALHVNATVSLDRLVDGLWGEDPPATAPKMVQLYVSRLRRLLCDEDAAIVTHGRGYELRVGDEAVDAKRLEQLVALAERDGQDGHAATEALALWRGAALADVAAEPFARTEIARLEALRLRAGELLLEHLLVTGRNERALALLDILQEQHPLHEGLHGRRMLALYRSGRQVEALAAYRAARRALVEDAGVEPGARLRALHERILRQDRELLGPAADDGPAAAPPEEPAAARPPPDEPAIAAAARPTAQGGRRRRPWAAAASVLAVCALLAGVLAVLLTRGGDDGLDGLRADAVGVVDAEAAKLRVAYGLGTAPGAVAAGAGSIWVAGPRDDTLTRIRPGGRRIDALDAGPVPGALAFGGGSLWVAGAEDGAIAQVDPIANRVVQRLPVGNGLRGITAGHGALWVTAALDGEVVRLDLRSGRVTRRTAVGGQPIAVAAGAGAVWVVAENTGRVLRLDPASGDVVAAVNVGRGPSAVVVAAGAVWTANSEDGTISRIDPRTDRVTDTTTVGGRPVALASASGRLWIADAARRRVLALDPTTRRVTASITTGSSPVALAGVGGELWVSAVAPPAAHRGGTLRIGLYEVALDPAVGGYDPGATTIIKLLSDGLLAYRRAAGPAGARLVGALATDVPEAGQDGRRYVFRLRRGLRYADGAPVRARDVRASFERLLTPGVGDPMAAVLYGAIRDAAGCRPGRHCDLRRGILTDDATGTVTIVLTRPDPDFLQKLTLPLAAVLPADTPRRALDRPPPGTGPYRLARLTPRREALLVRNPHFTERDGEERAVGFADRVLVTMDDEETALLRGVEQGRLDITQIFSSATPATIQALRTRAGTRLRSMGAAFVELIWLDTRRAPFDDVGVRRALSLAIDRRRVVDVTGGPYAASPTCQILPPGMPGYRPVCAATAQPTPAGTWIAPDRERARRLVAASGARGTPVELWAWAERRAAARHVAAVLRDLGFPTRLRVFADLGAIGRATEDPRQRPQAGWTGWLADFPEPAGFVRALVGCGEQASNFSRFCDPRLDAAIHRAQAEGGAAGDAWARIENRVEALAPVVPLDSRRRVVLTSRRLGNVRFHQTDGALYEQMWVR